MPSPGQRHGVVCGNLAFVFGLYIRQIRRGFVVANDAGLILERDPDTVRGPDVAVYTLVKKYEDLPTRYPEEMPPLVVEVLSPSDRTSRMMRRLNRFLDKGIALVWLVDPESRNVTIWWRNQAPIVLEDHEEIANLPGLPDFRCKVAEIFDAPGA
jgi:Uma2 family endonuclease